MYFLFWPNISHDWKEDTFLYTMICRLTIISFNYHVYTGIYDKMHRLTREVDTVLCSNVHDVKWQQNYKIALFLEFFYLKRDYMYQFVSCDHTMFC